MFGAAPPPQTETTPFHPRSPYAVAKVAAFWATVNYREAYGMFASNGILFNHESRAAARPSSPARSRAPSRASRHGLQDKLYLGNLDAKRDWGYAPDYVEAMWLMLQHDEPDDFVIATGETHTVREFVEAAFAHAGLDWEPHVEIDPRYFRPSEVDVLLGDADQGARACSAGSRRSSFDELVRIMVDADVAALEDQLAGKVTRYSHEGNRVIRLEEHRRISCSRPRVACGRRRGHVAVLETRTDPPTYRLAAVDCRHRSPPREVRGVFRCLSELAYRELLYFLTSASSRSATSRACSVCAGPCCQPSS